ncbi:MAG: gamma-glutamyltransferase, partial [Kiloniellales bacterium]|nr:gamma-glutamyltransferase [Kiloniellales bacterium]
TMKPRDVLSYALDFAGGGYALVQNISDTIGRVEVLFREEWPTSAALYLPKGEIPKAGTLFRNAQLAETYERLIAEGEAAGSDRESQIEACRKAWSQGFVAEEIDRFCREQTLMDSSGKRHAGVLSGEDMAGWQAHYEAPLHFDYQGWRVYKGGPWSQGPVFLQQLAILEGFDLWAMDRLGPEFVHTVTEAAKLAFADREAFYGDPNFTAVPMEQLLSADYNKARRSLVSEAASLELRPGRIEGFGGEVQLGQAYESIEGDALGGGEPTVQISGEVRGDTCHIDVIDRWGNMVSATPSGGWLQSSPVIPALGFCLNSRAQMFWLEEGLPSTLGPGRRPRTTLSVNLARRDTDQAMVFGTPGGDYQDQWSLTFFLRHLHHGLNLQEAIDTPMFQTDHMPSSFWPRQADLGSLFLEDRFPKESIDALSRRGHKTVILDGWSLGRISAARKDGPLLRAGANARFMQGYAIGR